MFEKEAESYATRECCMTCNNINHFCKEKCECWNFAKKGAELGYNKANEWHDLRKDPTDLPKDNDEKLCFYGKGKVVARYCSEYGCWETEFNNLVTTFSSSILIAWREIVFPKEIEEK